LAASETNSESRKDMKKHFLVLMAIVTFSAAIYPMGGGFYYAGNEKDSTKRFGPGKRSGQLLKYGRWEVRSKIMSGSGATGGFILVNWKGANPWEDPPEIDYWHEVDIEFNGLNPNQMETTLHENELTYMNPDRNYLYFHHTFPFDVEADYHTWAIEWTPNRVIFEFDGVPFRWGQLDGAGYTHDFQYDMENYNWDNAPAPADTIKEVILGDDPVTKEREEISWVKLLQDAEAAFGNDCWAGCEPNWCGEWSEENCGNYMAWSWFRYYEYREDNDGDNGSCFKLVHSENFTDSSIMDYDSTDDYYEPSWLSIYGDVAMKDGKLVAYYTDDSLSFINGQPRIATGCSASDHNRAIMEDAEDMDAEIPENTNLRQADSHPPELATFGEMYNAKRLGANILKCKGNKIEYHLNMASHVNLSVFNLEGRLVRTLVNENKSADVHKLIIDKSTLAGGTYTLVLQTPGARNVINFVTLSSKRR
jgi:hypothetical protein